METHTPEPAGPMLAMPPPAEFPTKVVPTGTTAGFHPDDGAIAALIGGVVGGVLLLLIVAVAVLLWLLSRHKGSYVTNEMEDDEDEYDEPRDDESVGSDAALQPLRVKEDEEEE